MHAALVWRAIWHVTTHCRLLDRCVCTPLLSSHSHAWDACVNTDCTLLAAGQTPCPTCTTLLMSQSHAFDACLETILYDAAHCRLLDRRCAKRAPGCVWLQCSRQLWARHGLRTRLGTQWNSKTGVSKAVFDVGKWRGLWER